MSNQEGAWVHISSRQFTHCDLNGYGDGREYIRSLIERDIEKGKRYIQDDTPCQVCGCTGDKSCGEGYPPYHHCTLNGELKCPCCQAKEQEIYCG